MIDYSKILRTLTISYLVLKPQEDDFLILDLNQRYLDTAGAERKDLEGKLLFEVFPDNKPFSDGYERLQASLNKVMATKTEDLIDCLRYDIPVRGTDRYLEKYWSPQSVPVLDDHGQVEYILHLVKDITEQVLSGKKEKLVLEELEKKRQQYLHFIEVNPDGLYTLDSAGKFLSANEGLALMLDMPLKELLQTNFMALAHHEDRKKILTHSEMAMAGEPHLFEARFLSAKGRELFLEINLLPTTLNGKIVGVYGIAKDKTQLRKTEKVVTEKSNFLEANASFISHLLENEWEAPALEKAFAIIGQAVQVDRMYYFAAHKRSGSGEIYISQQVEWVSEHTTSQLDNPEMQEMPTSEVYQLMGPLSRNSPFTAKVSELEESTFKQIFIDQDIKAMLILPIFLKNELYGFIGFDDCKTERSWREEEIRFLQSLAHNLTTALEKRSAEESLKQQTREIEQLNERYLLAATATQDLIYDCDLRKDTVNRFHGSLESIFGHPSTVVGQKDFWRNHIHPEDLEKDTLQLNEVLQDPSANFMASKYRFRRADGSYAQIADKAYIIRDEMGVGIRLVGAMSDISMLTAQKEALRVNNRRYKMAMKATREVIWDWDISQDEVERSNSFGKIYGYTEAESANIDFWFKKVVPKDRERVRASVLTAIEDETQKKWKAAYDFVASNGQVLHVMDRAYISRDEKGRAIRMVGAVLDVTQTRRTWEKLKKQNELLRRISWDQSHLVRAPLVRLQGLLDLMEAEPLEDYVGSDIWKYIRDSAEELDGIIRGIVRKTEEVEV